MSKPIYIYEGGGSNPHIIGAIDTDKYSDHDSRAMYAVISKKVNNVSTLEVRISTNCEASKTITKTSDLVLYDTDGNLQEFHITDIDDIEEYSVERYIYAEQSIGELINDMIQAGTAMPTTTDPADYLAYILSFTRWSVGTVDPGIYNSKWEEDLTGKNCLEALQMFIDKYNCEFEVRYTTDEKNKITGRYLDIKKTIGHNYGKRFEDDKDITQLKRNMDLDSVKTAIYPRIAKNVQDENGDSHTEYVDISSVVWSVAAGDPVDKPAGQTVLYNPQADNMYKRYNTKNGKLMDRIMYAEWTESTATDAENLCKQAWTILQANSVLNPTIELDASDLFRLSGDNPDYWHEQVALGDTCIIIAKQFDPELRVETRVMEMEEDLLNPINNSYVFGKYRKTLATSNIEQQKSIEEKLKELQNKVQGVIIPEPKPQYQSGRVYYEDIKEQVQNEFMQSGGYVMAEDADGFWVFDAPVTQTYSLRSRAATTVYPTKATILKGGSLAIAEYDTVTAQWVVGTFINGLSVNADYINTGHLNGDVIDSHSITTDHLTVSAIEYIRSGLATDDDLNSVVVDIQNNYVTNTKLSDTVTNAIKELDLDAKIVNTKISAIQETFKAVTTEYKNNLQQAESLYSNSYLTGTAKTNLNNAKSDYTIKYNALKTAVDNIVNNTSISDANITAYNTAITNLQASTVTLGQRMQEAVKAINDAVYNSSKSYADDLKTDIDSDIQQVNNTVTDLGNTMNGAFKDGIINEVEAKAIASNISNLNAEKADVDNEYNTLYNNVNLTGTDKTNLKNKKDAYNTAYTNLINAINNAVSDNVVTEEEQTAIDSAMTAHNTALGEYRVATQNAIDAIANKKVTDATTDLVSSSTLTDSINNAVKGLATESYVDSAVSTGKTEAEIAAQVKAIKDLQRQVKSDYESNKAVADKVYADQYLPAGSTAKTGLNSAITAYTNAYNTYYNQITEMLKDNTITTAEYNTYVTNSNNYATALKNLSTAIEEANNARLANVYAQARQGLVTTADLQVNNESVIASAKAGMVSTSDMTEAISFATKDFVTSSDMDSAISSAIDEKIDTGSLSAEVVSAKIESIKQAYNAISVEYANNKKQADTLYSNSYLSGTAKTNLNSAISDYTTKYSALTTAYNDIVNKKTLTADQATAWNTAVTNLKTSTETLGQRMQEAVTAINTAVYNKAYNDAYSRAEEYTNGVKTAMDKEISDVNTAVSDLNTTMTGSFKDSVIDEAETLAIKSNIQILNAEKADIGKEYTNLYANAKLTGTPKTNLNSMKTAYNTAHTNLINAINTAISDNAITDTERTDVNNKFAAYNTALANYRNAVQDALNNIASNQASSAASSATESLRTEMTTTMNNAINDAVDGLAALTDVDTAKNNAILQSKIETIKQTYKAITAEYQNNLQQATTLYSNSYLAGTAKTNLNSAKSDYTTKYNTVTTAHNNIANDNTLSTEELNAWNTAVTNLQTSTKTLAQRMQEALTYINTAVYNSSKKYTDTAIPDALTGYAKTSYVDDAKAAAIADAKKGMVSTSQLEVNNTEILLKTASMGQYNMLRNTDFRDGMNYWSTWGTSDTEPIRVVRETDASPAAAMSGERNIGIISADNASTGNKSVGFYQDTKKCVVGVSYTVGYWINCTNCSCSVSIGSLDSAGTRSVLASKSYNNINGGHDRATWKYDSMTFTVPNGSATIRFACSLTNATNATHRVLMVKPMMTTGINAQAWTAHPDEIHVGVVSVTEEKGIMVEHSDSDTHSTLDATGLKIWDNETATPVASFGDGNEAYIGKVRTNTLYADNVTPTIKLTQSKGYYYSNTGSGDFSGSNSDNCCAGFTAAMAKFCEDHNVDTTHIHGNFMLEGDYDIGFYCHGSTHDEDIYLENIYGTGQLIFGYVKNLTVSGTLIMRNIQCKVRLFGNKGGVDINEGCTIKRIGARDGFYFRHCSKVEVEGFRFNNNSNTSNSGVAAVDGSNVLVRNCDIYNFKYGCYVDRQSTMWLWDTRGTSGFCGTMIPSTGLVIYRGKIPAGHSTNDVAHNIYIQGNGYRMSDYSGSTPAYSLQGKAPVTSKTVSQSYSAASYACYANYSITGEIRQGSWSGATSDWVGHVNFGTAGQAFLAGGSNSSGKIYLQRRNTSHGYNSAVPVIINGSNVGSLNRGEGKWFTLPASAITQIANGQDVLLNGKGNAQYIKFESNSVVTLTTTKSV